MDDACVLGLHRNVEGMRRECSGIGGGAGMSHDRLRFTVHAPDWHLRPWLPEGGDKEYGGSVLRTPD